MCCSIGSQSSSHWALLAWWRPATKHNVTAGKLGNTTVQYSIRESRNDEIKHWRINYVMQMMQSLKMEKNRSIWSCWFANACRVSYPSVLQCPIHRWKAWCELHWQWLHLFGHDADALLTRNTWILSFQLLTPSCEWNVIGFKFMYMTDVLSVWMVLNKHYKWQEKENQSELWQCPRQWK